MASSVSRTPSMSKTPEECALWIQHVQEVHSQRTPEVLEAARQRMERSREAEVSYRKCKVVKGHAVRTRALATESLLQLSTSREPDELLAAQNRWRSAQEASCSRMTRAEEALSVEFSTAPAELLDDADKEEEAAMEEAAKLVGARSKRSLAAFGEEGLATAFATVAGRGGHSSNTNGSKKSAANPAQQPVVAAAPVDVAPRDGAVQALLNQLRREPADSSECAVKFGLYEGYASEVERVRTSLLKFHAESRATVPDLVARGMDKQVKGIDSAQAMAIPRSSHEWFVYHMMRKAERNNLKMAAILSTFEKRLEFLAANDQSECPICFESFSESGYHSMETLSCCHKVCKDCWESWSAVMEGRPFCPLCRHDEFLDIVAVRVPSDPPKPKKISMSL